MSVIDGFVAGVGEIGNILNQWEMIGVFDYILPALLIFAVVFAILSKIDLFQDKTGVIVVISLAVAIMSLQFHIVPDFFAILFSKLGIGVSIMLTALILFGAFIPFGIGKAGWGNYVMMGLGIVIFFIVVLTSLSDYSWWGSWWWAQYGSAIVVAIILIALICLVIFAKTGSKKT